MALVVDGVIKNYGYGYLCTTALCIFAYVSIGLRATYVYPFPLSLCLYVWRSLRLPNTQLNCTLTVILYVCESRITVRYGITTLFGIFLALKE